jgi:hypothetical protein
MIGRPVKGTGFRGVLNYLGEKEHARLLGGDMAGRNARELAREFGILRRQRPGLKRAVAHMFLRPAPGEYLTDSQWRSIAAYYLAGMGFADSPHVLYLDTQPHPHLHLLASRITYGGAVVSDSNDYERSLGLIRNIERQYGLRIVSAHPELASPKPGDFGRSRRTGVPPLKTRLQGILGSLAYPITLREYLDQLHQHGVNLLPNIASTGRVSGISYVYEGQIMKGSDLGRGHTWSALAGRLNPAPGDPALLEDERRRAQEALATAPLPSATQDGSLPAVTPGPLEPSPVAIFDRLAVAEEALRTASPDTYVDRALNYDWQATRAERHLTSSLSAGDPASSEAETLARILLSEPGPPPTAYFLDRLLREDEAARSLVLDLRSDARRPLAIDDDSGFPVGASPAVGPDTFRQAIERELETRRELHRFELRAHALLNHEASANHLEPYEFRRLAESTKLLDSRIELSRLEREIDLNLLDSDLEPSAFAQDALLAQADELKRRISQAEERLALDPPAPLLSQPGALDNLLRLEPAPDRVSERIAQLYLSVDALERGLSASVRRSTQDLRQPLLEYLQSTDARRTLALESLHPSTSVIPPDEHLQTGRVVALYFLDSGDPLPPLTLTHVSAVRDEFRAAYFTLLGNDHDAHAGALAILLDRRFELDRTAIHAAAALYDLTRQGLTEPQRDEATYLQVIQQSVESHSLLDRRELLEGLLDPQTIAGGQGAEHLSLEPNRDLRLELDRVQSRLDELQRDEELQYYPRPARVAETESLPDPDPRISADFPGSGTDVVGLTADSEVRRSDLSAIAEAFKSDARFSPDPPFFLPPTHQELPALAAHADFAFSQREISDFDLRASTPETYQSLALSNAAISATVERVNQQLATFGPEPLPLELPARVLHPYLENRLQLHEALAGPPSKERDDIVSSLRERLVELDRPPQSFLTARAYGSVPLAELFEEHRRAYAQVREQLASPPRDQDLFRDAVGVALDRHRELERTSARLEGQLHARRRDHALLSSRLNRLDAVDHPQLLALERSIQTLQPLYYQTRIAIADRDLELLERHLQRRPSSESLDLYAQLLQDRETLGARLRESQAAAHSSQPSLDPAKARQALLDDPSELNLRQYREAVVAAFQAAERGSFASARATLDLRRGELRDANPDTPPPAPGEAHAALRAAADGYVEARQELAELASQPPRRGTTFDYAAHAQATDLSPDSLDRLHRSALSDLRRSHSAEAIPRTRPIEADHPGLSPEETLRLAVQRLQAREAALQARLDDFRVLQNHTPAGTRPQATPAINRSLVHDIESYRQALGDVERLSRPRLLSPLEFLRHKSFTNRPLEALASWTGYASRQGLTRSGIGSSLRSVGFPFVAGVASRTAQSAITSFFRDQVHER